MNNIPPEKLEIDYCQIVSGIIRRGVPGQYLGDANNKICRFCGKNKSETSFRSEAHVFPQFVGNKKLLSYYECDSCNKFFSEGIENSFANYFLPFNNFFRVSGSSYVPTYKFDDVRVEACSKSDTISTIQKSINSNFLQPSKNGELMFSYERHNYIPIAVFKCFVKMALAIMPSSELYEFENTVRWIMDNNHVNFYEDARRLILRMTLFKEHHFGSDILYGLLRNHNSSCVAPYMLFTISWGQIHCMIEIPTEKNMNRIEIEHMPQLLPKEIRTHQIEHFDLSSSKLII